MRLLYTIALLCIVGCSSDPKVLDSCRGVRVSTSIAMDATRVDLDGASLTWESDETIYIYRLESGDMYSNNIGELRIDPTTLSEDRKSAEFSSSSLSLETGVKYIAVTRSSNIAASDYVAFEPNSDSNNYYSKEQIEADLLLGSQIFELEYTYDIPTLYFNIEQTLVELDIRFSSGNEYVIESVLFEAENECFARYIRLNRDGSFGIKTGEEKSQIDCSVVANLKDVTIGGEYTTVSIPMRWNEQIDAKGSFMLTLTTPNQEYSTMEFEAKELSIGTIYYRAIDMDDPVATTDTESMLLMKLYDEYDGESWADCNWSLDLPIDEWTRVELDATNQVSGVDLSGTSISGEIPVDILSQLTSLKRLYLSQSEISGEIPEQLYEMTNLTHLDLSECELTGAISSAITDLTKLQLLLLNNNQLSGEIPYGVLSIIDGCSDSASLLYNNFTDEGNTPLYSDKSLWSLCAPFILAQNDDYGFGSSFTDCVYIESVDLTLLGGSTINTSTYFAEYEYTCIVEYDSTSENQALSEMAQQLYTTFESAGMGLITKCDDGDLSAANLGGLKVVDVDGGLIDKLALSEHYIVVDRSGNVVLSPYITDTDKLTSTDGSSLDLLRDFISDALKDNLLYIVLGTTSVEASPDGEDITVAVSSNTAWSVYTESTWITLSSSFGYNSSDYVVKIAKNDDVARVGTVIFATDSSTVTLEITQSRDTIPDFEAEDL